MKVENINNVKEIEEILSYLDNIICSENSRLLVNETSEIIRKVISC
jgi:hypothetical protein